MAAGMMKGNFEPPQTTQDELQQHYNTAHQAIDDLKAQLNGSLAEWTGTAREAYTQVQAEWDKAFASMNEILAAAHTHVGNARDVYMQNEDPIARGWGQ